MMMTIIIIIIIKVLNYHNNNELYLCVNVFSLTELIEDTLNYN